MSKREVRVQCPWSAFPHRGWLVVVFSVNDQTCHLRCEAWEEKYDTGEVRPVSEGGGTYSAGSTPTLRCSGVLADGEWLHVAIRVETTELPPDLADPRTPTIMSTLEDGQWLSVFVVDAVSSEDHNLSDE